MFPSAKKVAFKAPLTEEIKTTKYTMAHADIDSSVSTMSTLELPEQEYPVKQAAMEEQPEEEGEAASQEMTPPPPQTGEKRESSDEEDEEDDSNSYPTTPIAGRRKRHRQWVWTLGPVEPAAEDTQLNGKDTGLEKTHGKDTVA